MNSQPDVFSYSDYRQYITDRVNNSAENWGLWTKLARAAGCQATYLSQSIKGRAHLTSDHIYGISRFWKLSESEVEFLLLLLEFAKAGTLELQNYYHNKIRKIKKEKENLAELLKKKRLDTSFTQSSSIENIYYSSWYWSAIHMAVAIPQFQTAQAISERFSLPVSFVQECLELLEKFQIIKNKNGKWSLDQANIHLPRNSPLVGIYHNNWRQKAVLNSNMNHKFEENIHFTSIYTMSLKDYQRIKEMILSLIQNVQEIVNPSKEEELVCFTSDFFKV